MPVGDKVRHVGDSVAVVVAESDTAARDAAAAVLVEYEVLPIVVSPEDAVAEGAPLLFEPHGDNVALAATDPEQSGLFGDADARAAMAQAARVFSLAHRGATQRTLAALAPMRARLG